MPISHLELKDFTHYSTFVECGSASGDGIQAALNSGFSEVHSIEINPYNYDECVKRFSNNRNVHLYLGDCGILLEKVLNFFDFACVLYLDANGWIEEKESPFHSSINAILRNGRKDHLLLVDDMNHGFSPREKVIEDLRWSKIHGNSQDVIRQVLRINNDYNLYVVDTHSEDLQRTYASWVLVADPNKSRLGMEYI